jgi:hypothetical protein
MRLHRTQTLALLGASVWGLSLPNPVRADDEPFAGSYVSVGGGVDEVTDRVGRFLQSETNAGGSVGADARLNVLDGLIFDLDYGRDQSSLNDLTITRQQGDFGLGYMGAVGRYSNWYVEAVYSHLQFQNSSQSLCGGDCLTETHDGVGVKGGFIFPLGDQWYSSLSAGYISMAAHNGFDGLGESLVNASIAYRLNPELSIGVRAEFMAYVDRGDNGLEEDFASWRAFVSYHF